MNDDPRFHTRKYGRVAATVHSGIYDQAVFPDERWNERDRYLNEREQKLDARERLLDAREQRLAAVEAETTARRRAVEEREVAAEQRGRRADERDAIADSREMNAGARERLLDERDAGDHEPSDPLNQIQGAFAREVARLDRSDAFLERSRDAVQRAQARLDALRAERQA
ncbi:hypothetical protein [Actinoplanes sp. NPDC026619]|uniref:hypothetical protein n=1 Tax=Actinoplanes sp. NPDC026619 TaxID=3155798 RepID=UPI0034050DE7